MEDLIVDSQQDKPNVSTVDRFAQIRKDAELRLGKETPPVPKQTPEPAPPPPKSTPKQAQEGTPQSPPPATPPIQEEVPIPDDSPYSMPMNFEKEMIGNFYTSIFDIVSLRLGEHWKLNPTEADMLADPTKKVLDKYSVKATPEFMLLTSATVIIAPRLVMSINDANEKKKKKQEEEKESKEPEVRLPPQAKSNKTDKPEPKPEPKPKPTGDKQPPPTPSHKVQHLVLQNVNSRKVK